MKIEIDFDNKVIEVKDLATLGELVDKLKELNLKDWKSYKLKCGVEYISYPWVYPWTNPYITQPYQPPLPWITYGQDTGQPQQELPHTTCSVNN